MRIKKTCNSAFTSLSSIFLFDYFQRVELLRTTSIVHWIKKTLVSTWSLNQNLYIKEFYKDAILLNNAWIFCFFNRSISCHYFSELFLIFIYIPSWYWNLWVRLIGPSVEGVLGLEPKVTTYFVTSIMLGNLSLTHALVFSGMYIVHILLSVLCSV